MLLGLDLGTGSVKAVLLSPDGGVLGEGSAPCSVDSPRPGWAESSPDGWWRAAAEAGRAAVGRRGGEVEAVGLSGQMHGVVLTDRDGRPLRPAVLWADARSVGQLQGYRELDADLRRRLANPPSVGMAGPSLLWLREYEPGAYDSARWALQPKDWLRFRLTGEVSGEPSDASATLLYDLPSDGWSGEVAQALGLRPDLLPPIAASGAAAGTLSREAAEELGIPAGIPVAAGAADTAAAALGTGLLHPGTIQLTVGTGAQILTPMDTPNPDPEERTHLYRSVVGPTMDSGRFYAMAAVQNAGLALEWALGILGATWEDAYEEAFAVDPGAGGVTFLPYLSGERTPHFDPDARGAWTGLGLGHGRGHLLRAALEGVAFSLREALEALEAAGATGDRELRLAGGGTVHAPWRELLSDVLGRSLRTLPPAVAANASARGAALLGGVAAGVYGSVEDTLTVAPEPEDTVHPGGNSENYEGAYARYLEIYPGLYRR